MERENEELQQQEARSELVQLQEMEALWHMFDREREYYLDKIWTLEQELEVPKWIAPKNSVSTAVVRTLETDSRTVDMPSSEDEKGGESHIPVTR